MGNVMVGSSRWWGLLAMDIRTKGRVERGIERELYFTEPPPYISPISSGLRWRGERYIPKNVFFLREEVLIYDAPESATFPRMFFSSADQKSPEEAMP